MSPHLLKSSTCTQRQNSWETELSMWTKCTQKERFNVRGQSQSFSLFNSTPSRVLRTSPSLLTILRDWKTKDMLSKLLNAWFTMPDRPISRLWKMPGGCSCPSAASAGYGCICFPVAEELWCLIPQLWVLWGMCFVVLDAQVVIYSPEADLRSPRRPLSKVST